IIIRGLEYSHSPPHHHLIITLPPKLNKLSSHPRHRRARLSVVIMIITITKVLLSSVGSPLK
ncbi:MAG: hypothetical protein QXV08_00005, partial [Desulfurococcus sp.]|uniref:hypothetical protein n=1 Tax=Desulfurococcus sp. TaxID=51678 RepID=UPI00317CB668